MIIVEEDNESLKDKVSKVLLDVNQKPHLRQVVRLGQPIGRCRPARVSLESFASVHSILKESTKFKSSTMYSKIFISPDRTPEECMISCTLFTLLSREAPPHVAHVN